VASLFQTYLPQRYQSMTAHVVDSNGGFTDQIDIVIFDRQYTPVIFRFEGQTVIPAESVYAAFEAKQTVNSELIRYAGAKVASVMSAVQPHSMQIAGQRLSHIDASKSSSMFWNPSASQSSRSRTALIV
jgi:hypothetical protein